ncbi:MAG TPA: BON domain-containing protein [Bryobacteraceae bacterium]|nr:BON domain-containing protein [Bryobacteraceae bacterium]
MKYKSILFAAALSAALAAPMGARTPSPLIHRLYFADKPVSDDALHDMVMRRLANDADVKGSGLQIEVKDGVVTLRGKLDTEKQIQRAEKLAKKISGVKKVINEITLSKK